MGKQKKDFWKLKSTDPHTGVDPKKKQKGYSITITRFDCEMTYSENGMIPQLIVQGTKGNNNRILIDLVFYSGEKFRGKAVIHHQYEELLVTEIQIVMHSDLIFGLMMYLNSCDSSNSFSFSVLTQVDEDGDEEAIKLSWHDVRILEK